MDVKSGGGPVDFVQQLGTSVALAMSGSERGELADAVLELVELSPLPIVIADASGNLVVENRPARKLTERLPAAGLEQWQGLVEGRALSAGASPVSGSGRIRFQVPSGPLSSIDVCWASIPMPGPSKVAGPLRAVLSTTTAPLGAPNDPDLWWNVFDGTKVGVAVVDPAPDAVQTVRYANRAFFDVTGFSYEELADADEESFLQRLIPSDRRAGEPSQPYEGRVRASQPGSGPRWLDVRGVPAVDPFGAVRSGVWFVTDVASDAAFAERYRSLFEQGSGLVFEVTIAEDRTWVSYLNPQCEAWLGDIAGNVLSGDFSEVAGWFDAEQITELLDELSCTEAVTRHLEVHRPGNDTTLVHLSATEITTGSVRQILGMAHDVTERRLLEAEDARRQKLESLARVSGGLAHEINNSMMVARGHVELLESHDDDRIERRAAMAGSALDHAIEIASQLTSMARPAARVGKVVTLDSWLRDAVSRLRPALRSETVVLETFAADGFEVKVETGRLEQVLLNLLLNANEAAGTDAMISISTSVRRLATAQREVIIEIEDNGPGIQQSVLSTIFEPFVTTKANGSGTGLGLAVSYRLIEEMGGRLSCHNSKAGGAVFTIALPEGDASDPSDAPPADVEHEGVQTVLLVDDQQAILSVMGEALRSAGFQTIECVDPGAASKYFAVADLLVTDLSMPDIDGIELAEAFLSARPARPVALVSGFIPEDLSLEVADAVLLKPFRLTELVETCLQLTASSEGAPPPALSSAGSAP